MNQEQAKKLVGHLLLAAQKAKSNLAEALSGHEEPSGMELRVLQTLHPSLFDDTRLNLVAVLYRYAQKDVLEPMDVYNALFLCSQDVVVETVYVMLYDQPGLPDALATMKTMQEGASHEADNR